MMSDSHRSLAAHRMKQTRGDPLKMLLAMGPGGLGAVVGATLWLIARPDRPVKAPWRTILEDRMVTPISVGIISLQPGWLVAA
jgi:hypothetical protein